MTLQMTYTYASMVDVHLSRLSEVPGIGVTCTWGGNMNSWRVSVGAKKQKWRVGTVAETRAGT